MKRFLLIGNGGREAIFAKKLGEDAKVFAVMEHPNPTILEQVQKTGGNYLITSLSSHQEIITFARNCQIDYVFVSADTPLSEGIIDAMLKEGVQAIGPTKSGAQIEWDKVYSIDTVYKLFPSITPHYAIVNDQTAESSLQSLIEEFKAKNMEIVVKPQGLTGGKGVKVMGEHLKSYAEAYDYIKELQQAKNQDVLVVEKLQGHEFTIMGICDQDYILPTPTTYDYPYRFADDKGPGTGGMGTFTQADGLLPFLNQDDYDQCLEVMQGVLSELKKQGRLFNGVINGGFFKTSKGIRFMEFNGRFGDPEGINVLGLLTSSFSEMLVAIYANNLKDYKARFIKQASVVKYLVSPSYPQQGEAVNFKLNPDDFASQEVSVLFSAAKQTDELLAGTRSYQTTGSSRVVALVAQAATAEAAAVKINQTIASKFEGDLDYRMDIATKQDIAKLS